LLSNNPKASSYQFKKSEKGGEKMKKKVLCAVPVFIVFVSLLLGGHAYAWHDWPGARTIDPIVSTDWLYENIDLAGLVILDIRGADNYATAHIANSINEPLVNPFATKWLVSDFEGLWLELPETGALFETIGNLGITSESLVVIVTTPNPGEPPFYGLCNATRVADTLIYAGVKDVAILDGGYPKWVADGYETTTDVPEVEPVTYEGEVNRRMFVSIDYVRSHIWKADIIDARDADVYYGVTIELPFAPEAGHIPNAASLPGPWVWDLNSDGTYTYKDPETLGAMASGVISKPWGYKGYWGRPIIVYCGVGGYASIWWYVLTQVLEYKNVKFYDGAAQEWIMEGYQMVPFRWD
jgi:thiosulfate/3-mercaptopyruvate sulfurtransferase